jgi:hypothetical protein
MANWYYLMAQLPSFQVNARTPLPLTEEAFLELCSRFLDSATLRALKSLSLEPPRPLVPTGYAVIDAWNSAEHSLRVALAQIRAQKLHKQFDSPAETFRYETTQTARAASNMENPLSAEQHLNAFRAAYIESLSGTDFFSTDALLVYALRLKLAARIREFDEETGKASYRTIYAQILGETA